MQYAVCYDSLMKRVTITMPEDTCWAIEQVAIRTGQSFSATTVEIIEKQLASEPKVSPFEALIRGGQELSFSAADIDEELARTYADDIRRDSGLDH